MARKTYKCLIPACMGSARYIQLLRRRPWPLPVRNFRQFIARPQWARGLTAYAFYAPASIRLMRQAWRWLLLLLLLMKGRECARLEHVSICPSAHTTALIRLTVLLRTPPEIKIEVTIHSTIPCICTKVKVEIHRCARIPTRVVEIDERARVVIAGRAGDIDVVHHPLIQARNGTGGRQGLQPAIQFLDLLVLKFLHIGEHFELLLSGLELIEVGHWWWLWGDERVILCWVIAVLVGNHGEHVVALLGSQWGVTVGGLKMVKSG
jgi:hypothetical protein